MEDSCCGVLAVSGYGWLVAVAHVGPPLGATQFGHFAGEDLKTLFCVIDHRRVATGAARIRRVVAPDPLCPAPFV